MRGTDFPFASERDPFAWSSDELECVERQLDFLSGRFDGEADAPTPARSAQPAAPRRQRVMGVSVKRNDIS